MLICFFVFLFCAILLEKGQLTAYFIALETEAKSKFSRAFAKRQSMLRELSVHLGRSMSKMRKIMISHETTSRDILSSLQHIVKKSANTYTTLQVKYRLDEVILYCATQSLSAEIRGYFTNDLFC